MTKLEPILLAIAATFAVTVAHAEETKLACIAAADQGQQLRDDGKYRKARDAFLTCAQPTCPALIAKSCARWVGEVDLAMPTIVLAVRDPRGEDVARARVSLDGRVITETPDGLPIAVDPGEHAIRVERGGSFAVEERIVVRAGEKNRAVAVTLLPIETGAPVAPVIAAPAPVSAPPRAEAPGLLTPRNVTAAALLGAAALATVGSFVFAARSRDEADTAARYRATNPKSACAATTSSLCASWSDAVDAQNRDAIRSHIFLGAGAALAAGAIATWLLWPRPHASPEHDAAWIAPSLAPTGAGLDLGGTF